MARGNSKLYRVKESSIKIIPVVSNYYIEKAWFEGYVFVQEEDRPNEVRMITSTCSQNSYKIELINIDVVTSESIKSYRV